MKTISAMLVLLGLTIGSAAAEDGYRSTLSGTMTIEVAPNEGKQTVTAVKPGETLTLRFVPPAKAAEPHEDDLARKLEACADKWNAKLKAYEAGAPERQTYLAYSKRWERYPAQRAPAWGEPLLTRTTYRACMYACLQDAPDRCPGGWTAAAERKPEANK